jgi:hydroxyethylthiazole kinase-like uncharacterized protein yjeF
MHTERTPSAGPCRIATPNADVALHDAAATRRIERAALLREAPHALMRRAGQSVARLALALTPHARRVHVLAGPGNNGGDGLVAARLLAAAGVSVRVSLLGDPARLPEDAAQAHALALEAGIVTSDDLAGLDQADLVIDALLGLGARRAPQGRIADAIDATAALRAPVLAVDLPSGLHPDTGQALGRQAIRASATLTLLTLKPGLFTGAGREHAGDVWLDDLGVDPGAEPATGWLVGSTTARRALPPRAHSSHKGRYGDVFVVGGARGMTGAAWLAGGAALAAGAGRAWVSLLDDAAPATDATRPELMTRRAAWAEAPEVLRATTVACGCGGGDAVADALPPLLAHAGRLVLDADALNRIAVDPALQRSLVRRAEDGLPTILTPHPLEAARLLDSSTADVQADRQAAAASLAERCGCTVVLKGSGTVICSPGRVPSINPTGNALLASPGTGDVLAGWMAGLWSAGQASLDGHAAACASVWLHGRAADVQAQRRGSALPLRAGDLVDAIRRAAAG